MSMYWSEGHIALHWKRRKLLKYKNIARLSCWYELCLRLELENCLKTNKKAATGYNNVANLAYSTKNVQHSALKCLSVCTCWGRKLHHNLQQHTAGHAGLLHPNSSAVFPWKPQVARSLWWGHRTPQLRGLRCHRTWGDVDIYKTELAFCWLKTTDHVTCTSSACSPASL